MSTLAYVSGLGLGFAVSNFLEVASVSPLVGMFAGIALVFLGGISIFMTARNRPALAGSLLLFGFGCSSVLTSSLIKLSLGAA